MARYSASTSGVTNTASQSVLYGAMPASPARRAKIAEVLIGSGAAGADQAANYRIQRITDEAATPGGTAITPVAHEPTDPAANFSSFVADPSSEPTLDSSGIVLDLAIHQRATYRWVAQPDRGEIVIPATEDNGITILTQSVSSAFVISAVITFDE